MLRHRLVVEGSTGESQVASGHAPDQQHEVPSRRVRAPQVVGCARHVAAGARGGAARRIDARPRGRVAVEGLVQPVQRAGRGRVGDERVPQLLRIDERRRGTHALALELAEREVERRLRLPSDTALLVEARGRRRADPWMEDAEGVVDLLPLTARHLRDERGDGARESRCAVQVVAGIGHTPRVVGAEGVARRRQAGSRREAERREDDRDGAPRTGPDPRCVNAPAAETSRIGQWRTSYPDTVARPRGAHLGGGSSAPAGARSAKSFAPVLKAKGPTSRRGRRGPSGRVGPGPLQAVGPSPQNRTTGGSRRLRGECTELRPARQYRLEVTFVLPLARVQPGAPAFPYGAPGAARPGLA